MTPRQEKHRQRRFAFAEFIKLYPFTVEDLDGEEWRPIEGYDGYQVSNFGRVKSFRMKTPRILRPLINRNDYLTVRICENFEGKPLTVHRLVAKAFIPNPENKEFVNHIDGCKVNACVSNLEWATCTENNRHALATGLRKIPRGEQRKNAKLTNEQVVFIRDNPDNLTAVEFAKMFNVNRRSISRVQLGGRYTNAGGRIREARQVQPRLPDEIREQIRKEYVKCSSEYGSPALAKKYNCSGKTILRIVNGK